MLDTVSFLVYNSLGVKLSCFTLMEIIMSIKDGVYYAELYNEYGKMLTENQRSVFEMYCHLDLSLGEIAEIKSVSRQSVSDAIAKVKKLLDGWESKLGFHSKKTAINQLIDGFNGENGEIICQKIKKVLGDD